MRPGIQHVIPSQVRQAWRTAHPTICGFAERTIELKRAQEAINQRCIDYAHERLDRDIALQSSRLESGVPIDSWRVDPFRL